MQRLVRESLAASNAALDLQEATTKIADEMNSRSPRARGTQSRIHTSRRPHRHDRRRELYALVGHFGPLTIVHSETPEHSESVRDHGPVQCLNTPPG
jgi:hypothetical protein